MGEVYQATDTKLHREVALKLLPEALTQDAETLERFRREARALAALSHPNIGAIHGIEESDGRVALVLELIQGDTLADRIAAGTLTRSEVLRIAEQMAIALEAAHDQGIVHRDLKPANIKITPEGQVKVLDFGLAKSIQAEGAARGGVAESPTLMMTAAHPGMVMGTAPYMSPEQAKGAPVDRRADIWAYGAVVFEMLAGERLFEGDDVTEVLAAVISTAPDLSRLPHDTPEWLRDLIERCLRRDVRMRLPHMAAARIVLEEADEEVAAEVEIAAATAQGVGWIFVAATLVVGLAAGVFGRDLLTPAATGVPQASRYTEIVLDPPPTGVTTPAISPDGRFIAYSGGSATERGGIFVRDLSNGTTTVLPGSEHGTEPVFSPDSQTIAFVTAGILQTARLGGGQPLTVASVPGGPEGSAWLADDTIVLSTSGSRRLLRVAATGGLLEPIRIPSQDEDEGLWVSEPVALPGGRHLLVTVSGGRTDGAQVAVLSLEDGELTPIAAGSSPRFVGEATLIFVRRGELVAAPFDPAARALSGPERSLSPPGVVLSLAQGAGVVQLVGEIVRDGLGILPMEGPEANRLVWVDRSGQETLTGVEQAIGSGYQGFGGGIALSPDERRVAMIETDPVVVDLADVDRRLVLPWPGMRSSYPRWDPSGEHLAVIGNQTGAYLGYWLDAGGSGSPVAFTDVPNSIPTDFFPDGRSALGYVVTGDTGRDLWIFHLDGEDELLLQTPANERAAMLSPDASAYVYVSDESGDDRIYLRRLPDVGQAWQVSGDGAMEPRWSRDGSEVFFIQDGYMVAVNIDFSDGVRRGEARALFPVGAYMFDPFGNATYDVAADGRFLMMRIGRGPQIWRWIENWGADLDRIVQPDE
jgi:Tol biopolymer transport system component